MTNPPSADEMDQQERHPSSVIEDVVTDQQGSCSALVSEDDEVNEQSELNVERIEQQIQTLLEQANEILPKSCSTTIPTASIPYRLKDCRRNLVRWAYEFDHDGTMFDDLRTKGGKVVKRQLALLVDRLSDIKTCVTIAEDDLDFIRDNSKSYAQDQTKVEQSICNMFAQIGLLELSIQSLNGFTKPIQVLYAVDRGKGPFAAQQAQISKVMLEIKKPMQTDVAPKGDEKDVEQTPETPTSEISSPSSEIWSNEAHWTDASSMTSAATEDYTEFDLEPATDLYGDLGSSGGKPEFRAEPPSTEPPSTEPPSTVPPSTESPSTESPSTEPPSTKPPTNDSLYTEPPSEVEPTFEKSSGTGTYPSTGISAESRFPSSLQLGREFLGIQSPLPGVRIRATRTLAIHGHLEGPSTTPASLLAFRFDLSTKSTSSKIVRFGSLQVQLSFDQHPDEQHPTDSTISIIGFEPGGKGSVVRTETKSKDSDVVQVNLAGVIDAPTGPMEVKFEREKTQSYEVRALYQVDGRLQSSAAAERANRLFDVVKWTVRENIREQLGIGLSFAGAVLVSRNTDQPFTVCIDMGVELSWVQRFNFLTRSIFKKGQGPLRVKFDPNRDHGRPPAAVSKQHLGGAQARNWLLELVQQQQMTEPLSKF